MTGISQGSGRGWVSVHGLKLASRLEAQEWGGKGDSSTFISMEEDEAEEEAGGGNRA